MSKFKIEKGIPVAPYSTKYPFAHMEVGDSFCAPPPADRTSIAAAAYQSGKRLGRKFSVRNVDDGVRVWRVK